jgi:histone H3/H4
MVEIIVKSKIKELTSGFQVSGDFSDKLNEKVENLIKDACLRATANQRKTVMAKDL